MPVATICIAAISSLAAQDRPGMLCSFDGFGTNPKLAEVATAQSTTGYFGCASDKNCLPVNLSPGDPILVYRVERDWTCGYLSPRDGAGPGWVRSKDIRLVKFDPQPPLNAWEGTWAGGENRVTIQLLSTPRELDLKGAASWHGAGDVVHLGAFAGAASPKGNCLHFVEGGADSCIIDLTLIGTYIVARDNSRCGGMNVRFQGIWKRTDH